MTPHKWDLQFWLLEVTESRIEVARAWGEEIRSYCLTDIEFQFYKIKRAMGDGSNGYTTLWMYLNTS